MEKLNFTFAKGLFEMISYQNQVIFDLIISLSEDFFIIQNLVHFFGIKIIQIFRYVVQLE